MNERYAFHVKVVEKIVSKLAQGREKKGILLPYL